MPVYILELERPMGSHRHEARYYVGWAKNELTLPQRIEHHRRGTGADFTRAAVKQGINFRVVVVIPDGTRADERRIKNQHNTRRFVERWQRQHGGMGYEL